MTKFILFDLDGTLTDSKTGITNCVSYALEHFNIHRRPEELISFVGPPLKEQFILYGLSESDAENAVGFYRERFVPTGMFENKAYDGIIDVLKKLKNDGFTLAVATSKPTVQAMPIVERYGIKPYMTLVEGCGMDGRGTKSDVIRSVMKKLSAPVCNTVMIGDRIYDLQGAKDNGIHFIAAKYGYSAPGELDGCKYFANTVSDLYDTVKKIFFNI